MESGARSSAPAPNRTEDDELHLLDYWRVLVQRRGVVAGCLAVVVAAALLVTFLTTPLYTASALLEIERKAPEILEFTDILNVDPAGYRDFYTTQYRILLSRAVIELAVARTDLANRPEYASRRGSPIARLAGWVRSVIHPDTGNPLDDTERAVRFVQDSMAIEPLRNSQLVAVTFTDRDGQLAADLANAIASAYQQFQLDMRYTTTGQAKEFLGRDVARVRGDISELQRRLQAYGAEKEILGLSDGGLDITEQALADINSRYTEARTRLAAAEARHRALQDAEPAALPEVLASQTIHQLRQAATDLERRYEQMAQQFQPGWPPLVQVAEELATTREQLEREARTIAGQVRAVASTDLARSRAEVETLETEWRKQKDTVQRVNGDAIEYASLKGEIESKRQVLNDLVQRQSETETSYRLKETTASNIRIVEPAIAPDWPSSPRKLFNLAAAIGLGLVLGVGLAFVVDHLDNTVETENDVQQLTGAPVLAHVPLTSSLRAVEDRGPGDLTPQLDLASHLEPRSHFAETIRTLRTALLLATPDRPPRHVAVTGCEPGDGKSTVALNLAVVLTQLGRRVLIVDSDLRRPRLHKALGTPNEAGLSTYLSGNSAIDDLILESEVPRLWVIPSGPIPPNPSELLGSPRLSAFLERVRDEDLFDHVIFDSPPVLSVTDSVILATRADAAVLVVRARVTGKEACARSAARLRQSRANLVGSVLNAMPAEPGYYGRYLRYGYATRYAADGEQASPAPSGRFARLTRARKRRAG